MDNISKNRWYHKLTKDIKDKIHKNVCNNVWLIARKNVKINVPNDVIRNLQSYKNSVDINHNIWVNVRENIYSIIREKTTLLIQVDVAHYIWDDVNTFTQGNVFHNVRNNLKNEINE